MPTIFYIVIYFIAFLFGITVASFVNVLVYRIPRGLDFVKGRSFCPSCGHTLGALDLAPLLSWVFLKARCRYCGEKISPRYPLVELTGGLLAMACLWRFGWSWGLPVAFAVCMILLTLSLIDYDTHEIPDGLNIAMALCAVASIWAMPGLPLLERLIGMICVSVPMALINLLKPTSFGGGDILLMAAAGFLLGWKQTLLAMFLALLLGGGYGAYLLIGKKKEGKDHFAFGPALSAGIVLTLFTGNSIIMWYFALFML